MLTYFGVKDVSLSPLTKRDLLLFDKIFVPYLDVDLRHADASARADLEWLCHRGLISSADPVDQNEITVKRYSQTVALQMIGTLLYANVDEIAKCAHLRPAELTTVLRRAVLELSTRVASAKLQDTQGVRCVPIIEPLSEGEVFDAHRVIQELVPHAVRLLNDVMTGGETFMYAGETMTDGSDPHVVEGFADAITAVTPIDGKSQQASGRVVEIVLQGLPMPDESVSWEQIQDFRSDDRVRLHLLELRRWMVGVAAASISPMEIREQIETLRAEFAHHMRVQRLKSRVGWIRSVVTLPAVIGKAAKLDFAEAADLLMKRTEREALLLEAERTAPGREVAFIATAREHFR